MQACEQRPTRRHGRSTGRACTHLTSARYGALTMIAGRATLFGHSAWFERRGARTSTCTSTASLSHGLSRRGAAAEEEERDSPSWRLAAAAAPPKGLRGGGAGGAAAAASPPNVGAGASPPNVGAGASPPNVGAGGTAAAAVKGLANGFAAAATGWECAPSRLGRLAFLIFRLGGAPADALAAPLAAAPSAAAASPSSDTPRLRSSLGLSLGRSPPTSQPRGAAGAAHTPPSSSPPPPPPPPAMAWPPTSPPPPASPGWAMVGGPVHGTPRHGSRPAVVFSQQRSHRPQPAQPPVPVCDERDAIGSNRKQVEAIGSHQQPSAAISSHQQPSAAISNHQQPSEAISSRHDPSARRRPWAFRDGQEAAVPGGGQEAVQEAVQEMTTCDEGPCMPHCGHRTLPCQSRCTCS